MSQKIYDVVIIGSGPGGLNTALYASRAGLKTIFIEKSFPGGKIVQTNVVENWIGTETIVGADLAKAMLKHAKKFGAEQKYGDVAKLVHEGDLRQKVVLSDGEEILTKTVVIASGMKNREPSFIKNYEKFINRGVTFCSTCDGPMYANEDVAALGGGNSAAEESAFLAKTSKNVYLIVKDKEFVAEKYLVENLKKLKNVKIFMESQIVELQGENSIEAIVIRDKNNKEKTLKVKALFSFIGFIPNNEFFKGLNITNKAGFIETDQNMETKVKGIFAVGDIRAKDVRQIITAAADGAIAAKNILAKVNS